MESVIGPSDFEAQGNLDFFLTIVRLSFKVHEAGINSFQKTNSGPCCNH